MALGRRIVRRATRAGTCVLVGAIAACGSAQAITSHAGRTSHTKGAKIAEGARTSVTSFLHSYLNEYETDTYGPYRSGFWNNRQNDTCWACDAGGAITAAATLFVIDGDTQTRLYDEVVDSVNRAIDNRQQPNGGFTSPPVPGEVDSEQIDTAWYGDALGIVYYLLSTDLSPRVRATWQASLGRAADYIESSGGADWYANGNINLAYTELFWLAWNASGDSRFMTDYNASWAFVTGPPQNRWPGDGWVTVKAPTVSSGANGKGYFTESDDGHPGFDAEYSMIQLDVVSSLYLLSRDPRALRAANMIVNQELPRINLSTWMLDTSGGSRHPEPGRSVGWLTSAFAVLSLEGGRSDLLPYVVPDLTAEETWFGEPGQADSPQFRRAFGSDVSIVALASAIADGKYLGPTRESALRKLAQPNPRTRHAKPMNLVT